MKKREALFRGKSENTNEWVYGYLFVLDAGTEYEEVYILGELDRGNVDRYRGTIYGISECAERVIPETVGRLVNDPCYTDYLDLPYFQGDIIELFSYKMKDDKKCYGIVIDEHCFTEDGLGRRFPQDTLQGSVVGNVWDNPELVGEKSAERYKDRCRDYWSIRD